MNSSSRHSPWTRLRYYCFRFFVALLFLQFLLWSYLTLSKPVTTPVFTGRRGFAPRRIPSPLDQPTQLQQSAERVLDLEEISQNASALRVKETASDVVLSDTDRLPLRRERLADGVAKGSTSVPGVDDVFARLQEYMSFLTRESFYTELAAAKEKQKRTTAKEMNAEPMDDLKNMTSLDARITFLNSLATKAEENAKVRLSMFTTSSVNLNGCRSELLPWMQYHTQLGVTHFYILYDGRDLNAVDALNRIRHVTVMHIHPPFATDEEVLMFQAWTEKHRQWGGKPGNYELMVKQGYGTALSLEIARKRGDDWLLHMDPDEFFYPDNAGFSMVDEFFRQPDYVSSVRFMNFEGQPEFGDVTNRYEQVTLFRTHKYFITPEANYLRSRFKLGDNRTFLVLYANGKSAVRVDAPGVRQLGPHFFTGDTSDRWKTEENPRGEWRDAVSDTSFILHYGYSYLSDVTKKAQRSCPGDEFKRAAEIENREELGKCFLIDFDRDAYIAAITGEEEDFFYSRQVLSEGVRLKCRSGRMSGWCAVKNVDYFKFLLTKAGLFRRAREPQQILRMHEQLIQSLPQETEEQEELEDVHPLEQGWTWFP